MAIAGIDIGTTGSKISVYSVQGEPLYKAYRTYPAQRTASEHEADPRAIWAAVQELVDEAARHVPDIEGIGVSSFGESFVLLDDQDEPLMNVMLYTDPRGIAQCAALSKALGAGRIAEITGVTPHSMYSLPKLMWVKHNRPELLDKTRRILLIEDYVVYMLTGVSQIDYSLATRTMALDISTLSWSAEMLDTAGIDAALFSKPVPTGTVAGPLRPALQARWGLSGGVRVVNCCHDQVAAAVGAGVLEPGMAVDGAGTTECITPVFLQPRDKSRLYGGKYAIIPFVTPGQYVCYAFSFTGGALVKWFIDTLAGHAHAAAQAQGKSVYALLEEDMTQSPTGILALPHFAGAGTPYMDEGAKGALAGLTIEHSLADVYKAVLEGVAYEMRVNMEQLKAAGIRFTRLIATGGGAKSDKWLQIKADVLGVEIVSLGDSEAGIIGGIMLTGVATGAFSGLASAAATFIHDKGVFRPDPEMHARYDQIFSRYEKLYAALRPLV